MSTATDILKRELAEAQKRAAKVKEDTQQDIDAGKRAQRNLDNADREVADIQEALDSLAAVDRAKRVQA